MDVVELRNVFLYNTFIFLFWSNDTVLSTFTKNAIKSFVIGVGVLILILNNLPKVWFLDKNNYYFFSTNNLFAQITILWFL